IAEVERRDARRRVGEPAAQRPDRDPVAADRHDLAELDGDLEAVVVALQRADLHERAVRTADPHQVAELEAGDARSGGADAAGKAVDGDRAAAERADLTEARLELVMRRRRMLVGRERD